MKKIKKFKLQDQIILGSEEMKAISGGDTYTCNNGSSCRLYVGSLGIVVTGTCTGGMSGGSAVCYCQNGRFRTDPNSVSQCWG